MLECPNRVAEMREGPLMGDLLIGAGTHPPEAVRVQRLPGTDAESCRQRLFVHARVAELSIFM